VTAGRQCEAELWTGSLTRRWNSVSPLPLDWRHSAAPDGGTEQRFGSASPGYRPVQYRENVDKIFQIP
jgi:hypothetical protein